MFAWLGLIVTVSIWLGLAILLTKYHDRQLGSISAHGSSQKGAARLFKLILMVGGPLIYWWLLGWFIPELHLSVLFTVLLTVVVVYQIVTGANNGAHGWSKTVHDYTAQVMALLYIPLAILILESSHIGLAARIICSSLAAYMINSYVLVEVMKRFKHIHLVFQTAYIVAFQLLILAAAYLPR